MGENRQVTHMGKFQIIHVDTAPSNMGCAQWFSSRIHYCGKEVGGEESNFSVEKPDKHYFSQEFKQLNIISDKSRWEQSLLIRFDENGTLPLWSSSQGSITQYNYERNPNRGTFYQKNLTRALQNCQGHQKQEKAEKLSQPREPKETGWLNALWDPGAEKGH